MYVILKQSAPLILYILGIIVFFLSISGKVKYGLYFLVPLIPLQNVMGKIQDFPMGDNLNDLLLMGMIIGWWSSTVSKNEAFFSPSIYNKILIFYFFYTFFSLVRGSFFLGLPFPFDLGDARLQAWKNLMMLPLLYFIVKNNIRNRVDLRNLVLIMLFSMAVMDFYTVRQLSDMSSWFSRTKVHGTFAWLGANEVAAFYAAYTFIPLSLLSVVEKKIYKAFLIILVSLNFYCIIFLFSRGAYLATCAGLFVFFIFKKRILLIPLFLLLFFWQLILPQEVVDRVNYSENVGELDQSAKKRLDYWKNSFDFFKENPLFGIGFRTFISLGEKRDTHNLFLRTLSEEGLVGIIFLLMIMFFGVKKGYLFFKNNRDPFLKNLGLGFLTCTIAMIVANIFGDRWTYLQVGCYFWVFLGLIDREGEQDALPVESVQKTIITYGVPQFRENLI